MTGLRIFTPLLAGVIFVSTPILDCNGQEVESDGLFYGHIHTTLREPLQIHACPSTPVEVSASAQGLKLSSSETQFLINLDDIGSTEIVAGDFWKNGRCFIAIKSSTGLVNDLFEIHRMDAGNGKTKWSAINPEFAHGNIVSSYRDAARWHEETLCYSEAADSPFICSKRENVTEHVQRLISCNEKDECSDPLLVFTGTDNTATATVSAHRTFFLEKNGDSFDRLRSYLVMGDNVALLDFFDTGAELYFEVRYTGKDGLTTGWLPSADLFISDTE